jgi:hypothetical protein
MAQNCIIISGKGFYVWRHFDVGARKHWIEWDSSVEHAARLNSKFAQTTIDRLKNDHDIEAFIWKPFEEIKHEKRWKVELSKNFADDLAFYHVWPYTPTPISEKSFLTKTVEERAHPVNTFAKEKDAYQFAIEKNAILLAQISEKIAEKNTELGVTRGKLFSSKYGL